MKNGSSTRVIENNKRSRESKSKEPVDEIFEKLKLIHKNLRIENIFMGSNNDNEKKNFYGSTDAVNVEFQEKMVRNSTTPTAIVGTVRNWLLTDGTWSVPSYDLVWGAGHSYGGATIIVDKEYEEITIEQSFERMKLHENKRTGKCSDCVLVFHRIGEKLRSGNKRANPKNFIEERNRRDHVAQINVQSEGSNSRDIEIEDTDLRFESFNPFRQNGSLWVEIDCGHFYPKRDSWPACSSFISESQKQLDDIVPRNRSAHYPNVPNLNTADWKEQYYGAEGYRFLQKMKYIWDPNNFFYHAQSVTLSDEDSVVRLIDSRHDENHRNNSEFNHHVSSDYKRNGREDVYSQNPKLEERSADRVMEELRFFEASRLNSDNQLQRNTESRNRDKIRQNVKKTTLQKHCTRMYDRAANADPRNLFDVTRAIRSLFLTIQSVTEKILAVLKRTPLTKLI